jgi:hypothetical protein
VLVIVLPSVILGTPVAGKMRYQPPFYLGVQLAVSYLLATQIASGSFLKGKIWQAIFAAVITSGIVSCAINSQAQIWWNKEDSFRNLQAAQIINQANRPLLISNDWVSNIVSLSYMLDPKVRLQLVIDPNVPKVPKGFSDIFLFNSSDKLRNRLETEQNYKVVPINPDYLHLWKLSQ